MAVLESETTVSDSETIVSESESTISDSETAFSDSKVKGFGYFSFRPQQISRFIETIFKLK